MPARRRTPMSDAIIAITALIALLHAALVTTVALAAVFSRGTARRRAALEVLRLLLRRERRDGSDDRSDRRVRSDRIDPSGRSISGGVAARSRGTGRSPPPTTPRTRITHLRVRARSAPLLAFVPGRASSRLPRGARPRTCLGSRVFGFVSGRVCSGSCPVTRPRVRAGRASSGSCPVTRAWVGVRLLVVGSRFRTTAVGSRAWLGAGGVPLGVAGRLG